MKKIKQMRLKATLLAIVAVLSLGFTSCTDELGSDPTQGKPGYLTINVKTLQPKQTKVSGLETTDYQTMNDLNIFIFNGSIGTSDMLQQKYISGGYTSDAAITMQVGALPVGSIVVAVANYGAAITGITTYDDLLAIEVPTVGDFANNGLHMTGEATISGSGTYESHVNIAPVESKISVQWTLTEDADNYVVTGVYVVNAIDNTLLPIIRTRTYVSNWTADVATDKALGLKINPGTRTASYGLTPIITTGHDYNFYTGMTDLSATADDYLKDIVADGLITNNGTETYINDNTDALTSGLRYYVGENYHAALPAAGAGAYIINASANANTIVVVRVTPRSDAPAYIKAMGHKFYTYDFSESSSALNADDLVPSVTEGFSVRRKTNYNLTFNLTSIGASEPFVHLNTLTVHVTADEWNDGGSIIF